VKAVRTGAEPAEPEVFVTVRQPAAVTYFASTGDLADAIEAGGATAGHPLAAPVNGRPVGQCPECPDCAGPAA
jgi:hypothetical protein